MSVLSELDLALVNAVQVEPRAPWPVIGSSLGISAATAARRWEALKAARTAWTGSTMGPLLQMGAVVELRCRTGTVEAVAAALTSMPSVLTVGRTLGSFDLYALTVSPTPSALSAVAAGPISALDVLEARVHPYYRIFGGARWTLGILNRSQVAEIVEPRERVLTSSPASDLEKRLFLALGGDGRRSSADLAAELDVPAWTVRRQLALMRRRGLLEVRTDMARGLGVGLLPGCCGCASPTRTPRGPAGSSERGRRSGSPLPSFPPATCSSWSTSGHQGSCRPSPAACGPGTGPCASTTAAS